MAGEAERGTPEEMSEASGRADRMHAASASQGASRCVGKGRRVVWQGGTESGCGCRLERERATFQRCSPGVCGGRVNVGGCMSDVGEMCR